MTAVADIAAPRARVDRGRARFGLLIWALLFFNGLAFMSIPTIIPIPGGVGKLLTQSALALAAFLVLIFNRDRIVMPSVFLMLYTLLATSALFASLQFESGKGALFRSARLAVFIGVLWLLTPLWGRRDRVLLRWHIICLSTVLGTVAVGAVIAPGMARQIDGRLSGELWPIPPTQVGHYAAMLAGITLVLVVTGQMRGRIPWVLGGGSVVILVLTHTRTAMVGLGAGFVCALLVLFPVRRYARRTLIVAVVAVAIAVTAFGPALTEWYQRGQSSELVSNFNGRSKVWNALVEAPRNELEIVAGVGLTDKSFDGLPIDNSWFSAYNDEGLIGVAICAAVFLCLIMLALRQRPGPSLAVAVFIIVYCLIASVTETGLADVSPYLLDLTIAASLLASPIGARARR